MSYASLSRTPTFKLYLLFFLGLLSIPPLPYSNGCSNCLDVVSSDMLEHDKRVGYRTSGLRVNQDIPPPSAVF